MSGLDSQRIQDEAEGALRRIWQDLNDWADVAHQRGDATEHSVLCVAASHVNDSLNVFRRRRQEAERAKKGKK
jgi:hypothetical protein